MTRESAIRFIGAVVALATVAVTVAALINLSVS